MERGEVEPPIRLELTDELDLRYFKKQFTEFCIDDLVFLKSEEKDSNFPSFTFVGEEFETS